VPAIPSWLLEPLWDQFVNIQALGAGVAMRDRWLRFSVGCGVVVRAVRGLRDDRGL